MPRPERPLPRVWTRDELSADRAHAIDAFVTAWKSQGTAEYRRHFAAALAAVQGLFDQTDDLRSFGARPIWSARDIAPRQYCRQSDVAGTTADLTLGLRDRLLVIECKVSNSEVNSFKRLNHEVGDKASRWKTAFGDQAIPAAVLAGAFSLDNLDAAQRAGIAIFWEHNLSVLVSFVEQAI